MEVITEQEARSLGRTLYFTGKSCKRGHVAPRFVSTRNCTECNKERALSKNMTQTIQQKKNEKQKEAYWSNPEKSRGRNRIASRNHYYRHHKKNKLLAIQNEKIRKLRTPKWADKKSIFNFYENCPAGHEVDHIIPLQGVYVSGLHVANNLQYLTQFENRSKGRRYEV